MQAGIKFLMVDGRTLEVEAIVPDFIALERKFRIKTSDLAAGVSVEHLCFLGWSSLSRRGEAPGEFDDFVNRIASVEQAWTDSPKATRKAASRGS